MRKQKIESSARPDLLDLVERGIISEDAAREVIMSEKRQEEDKRSNELQLLFSAVHQSPITRGKDGRWRTRVPDGSGKLKLMAKVSLDDVERELRRAYFGDDLIDSERELATLATLYPRWLEKKKTDTARSFAVDRDAMMIMKECETMKRRKKVRSEFAFSIDEMPVTHNKLMKTVKTCCRIAGVEYRRPYAFRDTWITTLVDSGKFTLAEIADMAGNSPAVIIQHYYGNRRTVTNDTDYMTDALKGLKYRNKKCSKV